MLDFYLFFRATLPVVVVIIINNSVEVVLEFLFFDCVAFAGLFSIAVQIPGHLIKVI